MIDGSHIPIITPKDNPIDYYNRKKFHSIALQVMVDHEYKFMNTYVGSMMGVSLPILLCLREEKLEPLYHTRSGTFAGWRF